MFKKEGWYCLFENNPVEDSLADIIKMAMIDNYVRNHF